MVLGGSGAYTDVSLFFPATNAACRGPDLPHARHSHTAGDINTRTACRTAVSSPADLLADGSVLVCGGYGSPTSCERLEPRSSSWAHHASISSREEHSSWTAPSGDVILMGGNFNGYLDTTEVVGRGSSFTLARPAW